MFLVPRSHANMHTAKGDPQGDKQSFEGLTTHSHDYV